MVVVVTVFGGQWAYGRVDEQFQRRSLVEIERASEHAEKPIGVLSPSVSDEWSADIDKATESRARHLVGSGNAFLESVFYARYRGPFLPDGGRCYFLPVQEGETFDAQKVSGITRVCYTDRSGLPESISGVSVIR